MKSVWSRHDLRCCGPCKFVTFTNCYWLIDLCTNHIFLLLFYKNYLLLSKTLVQYYCYIISHQFYYQFIVLRLGFLLNPWSLCMMVAKHNPMEDNMEMCLFHDEPFTSENSLKHTNIKNSCDGYGCTRSRTKKWVAFTPLLISLEIFITYIENKLINLFFKTHLLKKMENLSAQTLIPRVWSWFNTRLLHL